ncbi:hypothetical protein SAMN02745176_00634, partial [Lutispora thermophila DSM 19022]
DMLGFKDDMTDFRADMMSFKDDMTDFKTDMMSFKKGTEGRLDRIEMKLEVMDDKLSEAFEAIEAHAEINERQHKEIMDELKGELNIVQLAVKRTAK